MKKTHYALKSILALLLIGVLFFSCKKQPSQIGLDIVGGNPLNVYFSDTASVEIYSILRDSVRTDKLQSNLLGVVVDPIFGTTKASLAVQYNLSLANFSFGESQSFDSIVLTIPYQQTSNYGDSAAPISFRVYELNELLDLDTSYYSNKKADFLPVLLGEATLVTRPFDSVLVDTLMKGPHFTLRLSDELGQRLMSFDDSLYFKNTDFVDQFKGLYFEPVYTSGAGSLAHLSMYSPLSKLTLYYNNSASDSLSYSFVVDSYSPSFQNYDHLDYIGADPDFYRQVVEKDTLEGAKKFYLQSMGGVDAIFRFPSLFNHIDFGKYAINEAKLIITNSDPQNNFIQPANMSLFQQKYSAADSTQVYYYIEDTGGGEAYFDGYYNSTDKQYEFRITKFLQKYISGVFESDKLLMQIAGANYRSARLVGGGYDATLNPESKIRLEIIYTDLKSEE